MALTVNTNTSANASVVQLNRTNRALSATYERISSGLRIVSAGDDAAGLGVAENLDSTSRGLRQAMRNTNDGISLLEVAESSASEVGNLLKRMKELAVQSSSESLHDDERAYIQAEFVQISGEIDRIANVTEFNGTKLSDGTNATLDIQVGVQDTADDRIAVTLGDLTSATLGVDTAGVDLSTAATAQAALTVIDSALDTVNAYRADMGASQNRLESAMRTIETYTEKVEGAESRIRDADFAFETAEMSKQNIMQQDRKSVV